MIKGVLFFKLHHEYSLMNLQVGKSLISDSYGKHPIHCNKYFLDFMNRNAVEWQHNKIQLQSAFSTVYIFCIIAVGKDRCQPL